MKPRVTMAAATRGISNEDIARRQLFSLLRFRLHPLAVFLDEVHETIHRLAFGNVEFDGRFANVEIDLPRRSADITEIRVRHFPGAVDDAAHNRNFYALE